jgi:large subunit ribosomal protein L20
MPRAVDGTRRKEHRKKLHELAKGYWGRRKNLFRITKDTVAKALVYAYRDRRRKKRDFRQLWITRISAACKDRNMTYSRFIEGLNKAEIAINRKVLSNLAIEDPKAFDEIVNKSKAALGV